MLSVLYALLWSGRWCLSVSNTRGFPQAIIPEAFSEALYGKVLKIYYNSKVQKGVIELLIIVILDFTFSKNDIPGGDYIWTAPLKTLFEETADLSDHTSSPRHPSISWQCKWCSQKCRFSHTEKRLKNVISSKCKSKLSHHFDSAMLVIHSVYALGNAVCLVTDDEFSKTLFSKEIQ